MAAMGVVPSLDEFEDGQARFYLGSEAAAVEQFTFERGKETLAHRVIEAIADRAHRGPHAGLAAALAEGERSVLGRFKRSLQHKVLAHPKDTGLRLPRGSSIQGLFAALN